MSDIPKLFTVKEVAELLKCSTAHVYRLCELGTLTATRINSPTCKRATYRIRQEAIEGFLAADKAPVAAPSSRSPGRPTPRHVRLRLSPRLNLAGGVA
jgi:excisionase family DNA binding protein